jgi:multiple sugar transport system substrate-binding protein
MSNSLKNKFFISFAILIIAIPFLWEFWLTNQNQKSEKKEIIFWQYWSGQEKQPLENLVEKFNSENHSFKVKMLSISLARKKILMAIAGEVPPDLVHLDGDMVADFALRNALSDLNPYMQDFKQEEFIPVYLKMLNFSGHQYALPLMPTCEAMHINKTLLDQYHLNSPETLEDIVKIFDTIKSKDHIAFLPSWPQWAGRFIPVVFGGKWADENGRISANSKANLEAWQWIVDNFASKLGANRLASFTEGFSAYQSPDNPFYASKIIIENSGVWEFKLAKTFAPKMKVEVKKFPGKIPNSTYVMVDALAIPRGAKYSKEAYEFMTWLLEPEQIEYLALEQGKFTPRKNHSNEFFTKHSNPYINVFIELANSPNAIYFPQLKFSSRFKRAIKDAYDKVIRLEQSPREALDELQRAFE